MTTLTTVYGNPGDPADYSFQHSRYSTFRLTGKATQKRDLWQAYNRWMANDEKPIVQRTKAALEQAEGKTIKTWKYTDEGQAIVLFFIDRTNLQVEMTYDREIKGVRNEPFLMAHLGHNKAK